MLDGIGLIPNNNKNQTTKKKISSLKDVIKSLKCMSSDEYDIYNDWIQKSPHCQNIQRIYTLNKWIEVLKWTC